MLSPAPPLGSRPPGKRRSPRGAGAQASARKAAPPPAGDTSTPPFSPRFWKIQVLRCLHATRSADSPRLLDATRLLRRRLLPLRVLSCGPRRPQALAPGKDEPPQDTETRREDATHRRRPASRGQSQPGSEPGSPLPPAQLPPLRRCPARPHRRGPSSRTIQVRPGPTICGGARRRRTLSVQNSSLSGRRREASVGSSSGSDFVSKTQLDYICVPGKGLRTAPSPSPPSGRWCRPNRRRNPEIIARVRCVGCHGNGGGGCAASVGPHAAALPR